MNIDIELHKLNKIVDDRTVPLFKNYKSSCCFSNLRVGIEVKYLLYVLELTYNHPEIEIYLKQLLENFSIAELNNFNDDDYTILHQMVYRPLNISLNSFEIIINFGIDVNSRTKNNYVPLDYISFVPLTHTVNIITLFGKHGANLNILDIERRTILDRIMRYKNLEHFKIIIMTLIDYGAKTNNPYWHIGEDILEFVESYRHVNIKPAIKK